MTRVEDTGEQIETLLARLGECGNGAGAMAEELTGLLVGLYGDGLGRIAARLADQGEAGAQMLRSLAEDPLVASLLLLHGLHPVDVDTRIQRALDEVRPYLGSHAGGVQYVGVTDGVARLVLEGSCNGCPSSTVTVQLAIERAVREAAPEVTEVAVEGMTALPEPALLQIGSKPPGLAGGGGTAGGVAAGGGAAGVGAAGGWVTLAGIGPPSSRPVTVSADGLPVLVCSVRGTLYAYRDECAACGSAMGGGRLDREVLTCTCGTSYDVSRAGAVRAGSGAGTAASDGGGPNRSGLHLEPLPLLADSHGVRVAVPASVRS